jgi:hypothetical protein
LLETRQQGWLMREIALVLSAAVRAGGDKGCLTVVSGDDVSHLMIASPCSQPALVEESRSHTATSTSQPAHALTDLGHQWLTLRRALSTKPCVQLL